MPVRVHVFWVVSVACYVQFLVLACAKLHARNQASDQGAQGPGRPCVRLEVGLVIHLLGVRCARFPMQRQRQPAEVSQKHRRLVMTKRFAVVAH